MTEAEKILVDNLVESLRQLQRYMVWSFGAAIYFLLLTISRPNEVLLKFDAIPGAISFNMAVTIVVTVYWVLGTQASFSLARAQRIISMLASQQDILNALLTYPCIPTTKVYGPRMALAVLPPVFVVTGFALVFGRALLSYWPIIGMLLLSVPHGVLTYELRTAVGGGNPDHHGD